MTAFIASHTHPSTNDYKYNATVKSAHSFPKYDQLIITKIQILNLI